MSEPLITYREATWNSRRTFELYSDRIEVTLKSQHVDGQDTIRWTELRPEIERLRLRPMMPFRMGMGFLIAGLLALMGSFLKPELNEEYHLLPCAIGLLIPGIVILAVFGRKVEYVRFKSHVGLARLDVAPSGPDKSQFELLASEIENRIRACLPRSTNG